MIIILFVVFHWYLSLFAQTFFLHRYGAHKMFTMSKFWERYFFVFTWVMQGSSFLNPRSYAVMHRMHHAYSDTAEDPHSPHHAHNVFHMMWKTKGLYAAIREFKFQAKPVFTKDFPEWRSFENFAEGAYSRIFWVVVYAAIYFFFASSPWLWLLFPITCLMGPTQGAVVNWCGHKYGYSTYRTGDKSKNTLPFDFLMLGELFQNNHHKFPMRPNFSVRWFEFDPVYPITKVLSWLKIIRFAQ